MSVFQSQCLKTKAPVGRMTARRMCEVWPTLVRLLGELHKVTERLDRIKKYVYYGDDEWAIEGDYCCLEGSALRVMGEVGPGSVTCALGTAKSGQNGLLATGESVLDLIHAVVGTATEAGELVEGLMSGLQQSQVIYKDGKPVVAVLVDIVNLLEEFGDLDWYKNLGLSSIGYNEEDARVAVLKKLETRYKGSSFSEWMAQERDAFMERMAIEESLEGQARLDKQV